MGYIYLITNLINNKQYVGQTTLTIEKRWERHIYDAIYKNDDFYFHKAIRKYGKEFFQIEKLCCCSNEELDEKEIFYIEKYKTYYIYGHGYNLTRGGRGGAKVNEKEILTLWNQGKSATEIAKDFGVYIRTITNVLKSNNISQEEIYSRSKKYGARYRQKTIFQYNFSGELIGIYKSLDNMNKETGYSKDYISAACRHQYPAANGYLWIYEDEQDSIENLLSKIPPETNHPVLQYTLDGQLIKEYPSYGMAAKEMNVSKTVISKAAKGLIKSSCGFLWKDKNSTQDIFDIQKQNNNKYADRKRQVIQYDLKNNYIASFNSIIDAAKAIGKEGSASAISKACSGKSKTSCGYIWKYKD